MTVFQRKSLFLLLWEVAFWFCLNHIKSDEINKQSTRASGFPQDNHKTKYTVVRDGSNRMPFLNFFFHKNLHLTDQQSTFYTIIYFCFDVSVFISQYRIPISVIGIQIFSYQKISRCQRPCNFAFCGRDEFEGHKNFNCQKNTMHCV